MSPGGAGARALGMPRRLGLAIVAIVASLGATASTRRPSQPARDGTSIFRGSVEGVTRRDTAAFWQLALRVAPTGRSSGIVFVSVAAGRSAVRDGSGRAYPLPGVRVGDRVTAWVHGPVMLSDPAYAFAESLLVAR